MSSLSTILPQQVASQQTWLAGAPATQQPSLEARASSSHGSAMDTAGDNNEGAAGRNGMAQRKRGKDVRTDSGPVLKIPRTSSEVRGPVHSNRQCTGHMVFGAKLIKGHWVDAGMTGVAVLMAVSRSAVRWSFMHRLIAS